MRPPKQPNAERRFRTADSGGQHSALSRQLSDRLQDYQIIVVREDLSIAVDVINSLLAKWGFSKLATYYL